jgi:hypothetical protein
MRISRLRVVPHLVATFTNNGSKDATRIMIALVELYFDGIIVLDHVQQVCACKSVDRWGLAYMSGIYRVLAAGPKVSLSLPFL